MRAFQLAFIKDPMKTTVMKTTVAGFDKKFAVYAVSAGTSIAVVSRGDRTLVLISRTFLKACEAVGVPCVEHTGHFVSTPTGLTGTTWMHPVCAILPEGGDAMIRVMKAEVSAHGEGVAFARELARAYKAAKDTLLLTVVTTFELP